MGAGNWVSGGVRRAVSGVRSAMPGRAEAESAVDPDSEVDTAGEPSAPSTPPAKPAEAPTDKPVAEHAPAKKSAAKKPAAAKKPPAAKKPAAAKKAPAAPKEPAAAAKKAPAPKKPAAPKEPAAAKKAPAAKEPATRRPSSAGKAPETPTPTASEPVPPAVVAVAWTDAELSAFQAALVADIARLREELNMGQADLAEMLAHGDGAGDDQADAGSQTLEREQEMSVAANARELLDQSTHALKRLEAGTYGVCESCSSVIPAARLRAFPRATLCIACKQAEERG